MSWFLTEVKLWGGKRRQFYSWHAFGESQLQSSHNSLAFTYAVLYTEFLHKNKPLTVSWWDSWSLWLPEWPIPWLEQEPAPGGSEKRQKCSCACERVLGKKGLLHVKQLVLPFLFYTCCRGAHSSPPSQEYFLPPGACTSQPHSQ